MEAEEGIFLENNYYYCYKNHTIEEEIVGIQPLAFCCNLFGSLHHSFVGNWVVEVVYIDLEEQLMCIEV